MNPNNTLAKELATLNPLAGGAAPEQPDRIRDAERAVIAKARAWREWRGINAFADEEASMELVDALARLDAARAGEPTP